MPLLMPGMILISVHMSNRQSHHSFVGMLCTWKSYPFWISFRLHYCTVLFINQEVYCLAFDFKTLLQNWIPQALVIRSIWLSSLQRSSSIIHFLCLEPCNTWFSLNVLPSCFWPHNVNDMDKKKPRDVHMLGFLRTNVFVLFLTKKTLGMLKYSLAKPKAGFIFSLCPKVHLKFGLEETKHKRKTSINDLGALQKCTLAIFRLKICSRQQVLLFSLFNSDL